MIFEENFNRNIYLMYWKNTNLYSCKLINCFWLQLNLDWCILTKLNIWLFLISAEPQLMLTAGPSNMMPPPQAPSPQPPYGGPAYPGMGGGVPTYGYSM